MSATDAQTMIANARKYARDEQRARVKAVKLECNNIMKVSKDKYVPVDEVEGGTLRDSGYVNTPTVDSNGTVTCQMGYAAPGSGAEAYGLATHEHPSKYSPPSWRNIRNVKGQFRAVHFTRGGPQYLARPLMDAENGMAGRIASVMYFELLRKS